MFAFVFVLLIEMEVRLFRKTDKRISDHAGL